MEEKLDDNYTIMLGAILNKSWRQHLTKQQLYGHLSPITKTIQVKRTRHTGHCWRSRDELISDILLWIASQWLTKVGRPARAYIQQLCADTDVALKISQKPWTIENGGRGGSRIFVLMVRHDGDDDFRTIYIDCFNLRNRFGLLFMAYQPLQLI